MVSKLLTFVGVMYLATLETGVSAENKPKNSGNKEKELKPNPHIIKDYICLRDGDLCHPNHVKNRGTYISCSNGVAWEKTCPKCTYHGITCPTKSLWFDGAKCDWASPKLASEPCVDSFSSEDINLHPLLASSMPVVSPEQESHHVAQKQVEKRQWSGKLTEGVMYYKIRKSGGQINFPQEVSGGDVDKSKVVRLNEPVYSLVNSPDGSEKKVQQRVTHPLVLEGSATGRTLLPILNYISPYATKE